MFHPHSSPLMLDKPLRQRLGECPWKPKAIRITSSFHLPLGKAGTSAGPTSSNAEHPHDTDDGGVDGQRSIDLNLLQRDAHDGQEHNSQVQLVPPGKSGMQLPERGKGAWGRVPGWHRKIDLRRACAFHF